MTTEPRIGPNGRDDDLTRALRSLYAPPAERGYWAALERRILARIDAAGIDEAWWSELARWVRVGTVAAAAALVLSGYALWRAQEAREQRAYEALVESSRVVPVQLATQDGTGAARDATLRYVISP